MGAYERIPADTFRTMQMSAGILCKDFNPDTGEFDNIIGATDGGVTIEATPDYKDHGENIDNCPKNVLELTTLESWECKVSGDYITASPTMIKTLLGSASLVDNHITLRNTLTEDDFQDIWFVGDYGPSGYFAVQLSNALNTKGFSSKSENNSHTKFSFEYKGHYSISNQDKVPLEIYIKSTVERHQVDYNLSNVKSFSSPQEVVHGGTLIATFEPRTGYDLPDTITVKVGGVEKTSGTDYVWTKSTGVLNIRPETTIGNISVKIEGTIQTYDVDYTGLSNVSAATGSTNPTSINYGEQFSAGFEADTGYDLPDTITVTVAGRELGSNRYSWKPNTGGLTIPGDEVKGKIVITITGVPE
jgi:hypothetical protein